MVTDDETLLPARRAVPGPGRPVRHELRERARRRAHRAVRRREPAHGRAGRRGRRGAARRGCRGSSPRCARNKARIVDAVGSIDGLARRRRPDPDGDGSSSITWFLPDAGDARSGSPRRCERKAIPCAQMYRGRPVYLNPACSRGAPRPAGRAVGVRRAPDRPHVRRGPVPADRGARRPVGDRAGRRRLLGHDCADVATAVRKVACACSRDQPGADPEARVVLESHGRSRAGGRSRMSSIRFAVVGCGTAARKIHLPALRAAGAEVTVFASRSRSSAESLRDAWASGAVVDRWEDAVTHPRRRRRGDRDAEREPLRGRVGARSPPASTCWSTSRWRARRPTPTR